MGATLATQLRKKVISPSTAVTRAASRKKEIISKFSLTKFDEVVCKAS